MRETRGLLAGWALSLATLTSSALGQVVINEVQGANHRTHAAADGSAHDWIELRNLGSASVSLMGWSLSDDPDDLRRWTFGQESIPAGGHLLVYASGLDMGQGLRWDTVIEDGDLWRYESGLPGPPAGWEEPDFNDSAWPQGPSGFGRGYPNLRTAVTGDVVYVRRSFDLSSAQLSDLRHLMLHLDYDDGFIAYLNGVEVARSKLGMRGVRPPAEEFATDQNQGVLQWDQSPQSFRLDSGLELLVEGENLLAIEVHNESAESADLSCTPLLSLGQSLSWLTPVQSNPQLNFQEDSLHTNFRVSSDGETLTLSNPSGAVVDQLVTGRLYLDQSVGRSASGAATVVHFLSPTPGSANSTEARPGFTAAPSISPPGGLLRSRRSIQLLSTTPGAELRYTLDGSDPNESSQLYRAGLSLPADKKGVIPLRVRAFAPGLWPSRVTTASYTTAHPHTLSVLSLVADPEQLWGADGLYSNTQAEEDRQLHATLITPDGRPAFSLDLGAKPHGQASLAYPQKPMALIARPGYGEGQIDYPVFGEDYRVTSFRRLLLRNAGQDFNRAMMRDALCGRIMSPEDIDASAYRPVVVYVNGEYWGIQNLRERHDKHYPEAHHGASTEAIDLLEGGGWDEHEGDNKHYFSVCEYLELNDLSDPAMYERARKVIDVDELCTYAISEDFFLNDDWPKNNVKFWAPRTLDGKWRWFQYDFDGSMGAWGTGPSESHLEVVFGGSNRLTQLLKDLHESPTFRRDFANRYLDLLNTTLSPANTLSILRRAAADIRAEVQRHLDRWFQPDLNWESDIHELEDFLQQRPAYARQQLASFFQLGPSHRLNLDVIPPRSGSIQLNSLQVNGPFEGEYLQGNPVTLTARTRPGFSFGGWSDGASTPTRTVDLSGDLSLTAHFHHGPAGSGRAVIAEIQYNSADEHDCGDWVELQNPGAAWLDIGGWSLSDDQLDQSWAIPVGTKLEPGVPLVLARDLEQFSAYHPGVNAVGPFHFGLSGAADSVRLFDATGTLVDEVSYTDELPWPVSADGTGRTLELINANADNAAPESWGASLAPYGTPGATNSLSS
ncbi:MAG: CotH kinase family protein [Planctomycetes bacterium]|nr:CotH kinase family protein [Planctomycetota bacterium]